MPLSPFLICCQIAQNLSFRAILARDNSMPAGMALFVAVDDVCHDYLECAPVTCCFQPFLTQSLMIWK